MLTDETVRMIPTLSPNELIMLTQTSPHYGEVIRQIYRNIRVIHIDYHQTVTRVHLGHRGGYDEVEIKARGVEGYPIRRGPNRKIFCHDLECFLGWILYLFPNTPIGHFNVTLQTINQQRFLHAHFDLFSAFNNNRQRRKCGLFSMRAFADPVIGPLKDVLEMMDIEEILVNTRHLTEFPESPILNSKRFSFVESSPFISEDILLSFNGLDGYISGSCLNETNLNKFLHRWMTDWECRVQKLYIGSSRIFEEYQPNLIMEGIEYLRIARMNFEDFMEEDNLTVFTIQRPCDGRIAMVAVESCVFMFDVTGYAHANEYTKRFRGTRRTPGDDPFFLR